jgi:Ser/Thr protein kinase RdoA (MazF antagonist)
MSSFNPSTPLDAAEGGPSNTSRIGATVRRAAGPWTPTVHALLRHLEEVGFEGSPRVVGNGLAAEGNEVLTYVEGLIQQPRPWAPEGIHHVGVLLRQLHEATASFVPPEGASWQPWYFHHSGPDTVIGHCDCGPWHIVARDGIPVAFIDWTLAGPVERHVEVAATAAWNAQLQDDDVAERHELPDAGSDDIVGRRDLRIRLRR